MSEEKDLKETIFIGDLNISTRTFNCLKKGRIATLDDLNKCGIERVLKIRNLGNTCFLNLTDALNDYYELLSEEWKEICETYSVLKKTDNEFYMLPLNTAIIIIKYYDSLSDIAQKGEGYLFSIKELKEYQYNTIGRLLFTKGYIKEKWTYTGFHSECVVHRLKRNGAYWNSKKEKNICLTKKERDIAYKRIIEHKTLQEIGDEYNISRERVRQMSDSSTKKLATLYLKAAIDSRKGDEHE